MSSTKENIDQSIKTAMKAGDKKRVGTLRLAMSEFKRLEIDSRKELQEDEVQACIVKLIKQRRESISQFSDAGRQDLVDTEQAEVVILEEYLPEQLSDAELAVEVEKVLAETGASAPADMGKVMGALKSRLQGKADMSKVSALVKAKLS